jgi:cysteinyl-tRNA synthetase
MIRIHNSLTGAKEPLKELEPGHVRMYVCGMTVYDYCHVGHARSMVVFDVVRRYLEWRGYRVTFVRNITDIDDNIIQRANRNGEPFDVLTERFIRAYHEDCTGLGIKPSDHEPRATGYIEEIIAMIERLLERGYAYVAADGDVLYSVSKFEGYGRLSGKKLADLRAGARVEVDEGKRDPLDFVLWKVAKPGEPAWDSPWGKGRPGWHIECSAMSTSLLGTHFDIHGGGMDLKFPHHENEIAQTCAACGSRFVNTWMHNGFVRIDDEKMSKSLGNFFTVREVLDWVRDPEVVRYFMLGSHYRGPINYTPDSLTQADSALERQYLSLRGVTPAATCDATAATARFVEAMDDDFNTPVAVAELQSLARELNTARAAGQAEVAAARAAELRTLGARLGLLQVDPEVFLRRQALKSPAGVGEAGAGGGDGGGDALGDADIERLIEARAAARRAKDFKESDRIRDELTAAGVVLEDQPGGKTLWRRG